MKNLWLIAGALLLTGCASNSDSPPETAATPPANVGRPQVTATFAPPVVVAPIITPTTPTVSENIAPTTDEQSSPSVEEKRRQVESLRSDINRLQNQRSFIEEQKRQFGTRNPNADPNERATGADSPNDARMAQYNLRLDELDSQITGKQKQIDDIMLN